MVSVTIGAAIFIDADAADGVSVTIEVAGELAHVVASFVVADGGEVVLCARGVVPVGGVAVGDVVHQLEVLAVI